MWPDVVHLNEIQSRLINEGMPAERAMLATSEIGLVRFGGTYRLERAAGALYLSATNLPGYYSVSAE